MCPCLSFPFFPLFPFYTPIPIRLPELIPPSQNPFRREHYHEQRPDARRPVELTFDDYSFLMFVAAELIDEMVGGGERDVAAAGVGCDGGERLLIEVEPLEFEIRPADLDRHLFRA